MVVLLVGLMRALASVPRRVWDWFVGPDLGDGFGQSLLDDLRYSRRARACRRRPTVWRAPTRAEAARWDAHPIIGRFGDMTIAVTEVDGRDWVVRENWWCGWPDPDRFPFFVMAGEEVWAASEFNFWPRVWGPEPGYKV